MHNRVWPEVLFTGLRFNFNVMIMIILKLLNDNECVLYAIYCEHLTIVILIILIMLL